MDISLYCNSYEGRPTLPPPIQERDQTFFFLRRRSNQCHPILCDHTIVHLFSFSGHYHVHSSTTSYTVKATKKKSLYIRIHVCNDH